MKVNLLSKEEFFNKLHQGCQIRVTYNKQFHDDCEEDEWWSEEYGYDELKEEIINQAKENKIDVKKLEFWWD